MKEKLKVLLDQQIAGVLPKIMEDEDLDDSEQDGNSPSQSPERDDSPGNPSGTKRSNNSPRIPGGGKVTQSPISLKKPGVAE